MSKFISFKILLIFTTFALNLFSSELFDGTAKSDVNVRSLPDYKSEISYVLRKNDQVKIEAIIKTKDKGSWYKINNGFVVERYIQTTAKNIPVQDFISKDIQKEETLVQEEKPLVPETKNETKTEEVVVEDIKQSTENDITEQIKPINKNDDEDLIEIKESEKKELEKEETVVEKDFTEPIVIKKEEGFIKKHINFTYIIYVLIGIVFIFVSVIIFAKLFSRPSISDQVNQHKKRTNSLKKVLSNTDNK